MLVYHQRWALCPAKEMFYLSREKVRILTRHYLHALLTEQLNRSGCYGAGWGVIHPLWVHMFQGRGMWIKNIRQAEQRYKRNRQRPRIE